MDVINRKEQSRITHHLDVVAERVVSLSGKKLSLFFWSAVELQRSQVSLVVVRDFFLGTGSALSEP
jgi:hypothetical protein